VHLRGHDNIRKRLLAHAGGLNLGLLMRMLYDVGTPRSLQGRVEALVATLWSLMRLPEIVSTMIWGRDESPTTPINSQMPRLLGGITFALEKAFAAGC